MDITRFAMNLVVSYLLVKRYWCFVQCVTTATVDLEDIRSYKCGFRSRSEVVSTRHLTYQSPTACFKSSRLGSNPGCGCARNEKPLTVASWAKSAIYCDRRNAFISTFFLIHSNSHNYNNASTNADILIPTHIIHK